jgi:beta propeller repeat protein
MVQSKISLVPVGLVALVALSALVACGGNIESDPPPARTTQALEARMLSSCTPDEQQNAPVISGSRVSWTGARLGSTSPNNFDVWALDLASTAPAENLTSTPLMQEFLQQVSGDHVVYTVTSSNIPGDIWAFDLRLRRISIIASSTQSVHFQQPAIAGDIVVFVRVDPTATEIYAWDHSWGLPVGNGFITRDGVSKHSPRTDGSWVVWENSINGGSSIAGASISPTVSAPFEVSATGKMADVDGGVVVFVDQAAGSDQIFLFDAVTHTTTQLTTASGAKLWPKISGGRIIWNDQRTGNYDVYGYDIATRTEVAIATGAGDQFLPDIDGDRVVYTTNEAGCEQVALTSFPVITPPPTVGSASNDVRAFFASGDIKNAGLENALLSQLAAAAAKRAAGDCAGAAAIYEAFIATVNAQSGKGITAAAASALVADARYLIEHCP